MDLKLILGPAVTAALVSAAISYINSRKKDNVQYITGERKEWRESIRNIASFLHEATYKETLQLLTDLKIRINAFGNKTGSKNYLNDSHIWELMEEIESEQLSDDLLKLKQEQLIEYLSLLLKVDWERSKLEVKGNIYSTVSYILFIGVFMYFSILTYHYNKNMSNFDLFAVIGHVIIIAFLIHICFMYVIEKICKKVLITSFSKKKNKIVMLLLGKFKEETLKYNICYLLHVVSVAIPFIIYSVYCKVIEGTLLKQTHINIILCILLYVLGLGFEYASEMILIDKNIYYISGINKIKESYTEKVKLLHKGTSKK